MDHREVGRIWDGNAPAWTKLARMGYDVYRDYLNTPTFLAMLPDVAGLRGLDIGCGEGHNTRLVADLGAQMTALDISATFVGYAREAEVSDPRSIAYLCASAVEMPFADATFDFAIATMSLMDMPEQDLALAETLRVLKPGGFLQFSITHPCFVTPVRRWIRDENGEKIGVLCGQYYDRQQGQIEEWLFSAAPAEVKAGLPKFRVPYFDLTLSEWLNMIIDSGFALERFVEPYPDDEAVRECPAIADDRIAPNFLVIRCRKPR